MKENDDDEVLGGGKKRCELKIAGPSISVERLCGAGLQCRFVPSPYRSSSSGSSRRGIEGVSNAARIDLGRVFRHRKSRFDEREGIDEAAQHAGRILSAGEN